jgi:hypothetical protein
VVCLGRWRPKPRQLWWRLGCGRSKGERECVERVAESVVHAAEVAVLGALGAAAAAGAPLGHGGRDHEQQQRERESERK